MSNHNMEMLQSGIIAASEAKTWGPARMEWGLNYILMDPGHTCLCTHHPITENCILKNELNGNEVWVGNVCVKKFMRMECHLIFDCLKRISLDPSCQLNKETIRYCFHRHIIDSWEYGFSLNTMKKRILSFRQNEQRVRINHQILERIMP